jgi:hypothetical protein
MMATPFLRCLRVPENLDEAFRSWGETIHALGEYQREHHPEQNWRTPAYTYTQPPPVIDISEDTEIDHVAEVNREMAENSDIKERVK